MFWEAKKEILLNTNLSIFLGGDKIQKDLLTIARSAAENLAAAAAAGISNNTQSKEKLEK